MSSAPAQAEPPCAVADVDGDADVDQDDLGALLAAFGTCQGDQWYNDNADTNGDNCVNQQDLGSLLECYGQSWDPCQGNQPPVAVASGPPQAFVNTPVSFDGDNSNDPDGTIVSWFWEFGDNGTSSQANPQHTYTQTGNYTVKLTVRDDCNASHTRQLSISITAQGGGPLQADFDVKMFMGGDLEEPNDWQPVGMSAGDPVEKGLKVKLDSSLSGGPVTAYYWQIGMWTSTEAQPLYQFNSNYPVTVKLTVYDAAWNSSQTTKSIHVVAPTLLSKMQNPGENFRPGPFVISGNDFWAINVEGATPGRIGVGDLSNPAALPNMTLMNTVATVPDARALARPGNLLLIARGAAGLDVYNASKNPQTFQKLVNHPSSTFSCTHVASVANIGDVVYITTYNPSKLRVYNFSNPNSPQFLGAVDAALSKVCVVDGKALVGHDSEGLITILDARVPGSPFVAETIDLGPIQTTTIRSAGRRVGVAGAATEILDLEIPDAPTEPITVAGMKSLPSAPEFAFNEGRLFMLGDTKLNVHDIAWPNPYQMVQQSGMAPPVTVSFLHDPDGATGPLSPVLFAANGFGLEAHRPQ